MNSELFLLALVVWREAQNQSDDAKLGVAWCVLNRAAKPGWWGHDLISVIWHPSQFSSFNSNDPNSRKWPSSSDSSWQACCAVARGAIDGSMADPTGGATYYFDKSLDSNPPAWASTYQHVSDLGDFHFYKG